MADAKRPSVDAYVWSEVGWIKNQQRQPLKELLYVVLPMNSRASLVQRTRHSALCSINTAC